MPPPSDIGSVCVPVKANKIRVLINIHLYKCQEGNDHNRLSDPSLSENNLFRSAIPNILPPRSSRRSPESGLSPRRLIPSSSALLPSHPPHVRRGGAGSVVPAPPESSGGVGLEVLPEVRDDPVAVDDRGGDLRGQDRGPNLREKLAHPDPEIRGIPDHRRQVGQERSPERFLESKIRPRLEMVEDPGVPVVDLPAEGPGDLRIRHLPPPSR